jgi:hypothetical protein
MIAAARYHVVHQFTTWYKPVVLSSLWPPSAEVPMSLCRNVKAAAGAAAFSEPAGRAARFGFPVQLTLAMCCMAIRGFFRNVDHVAAFHIEVDVTRLGLPPARDSH